MSKDNKDFFKKKNEWSEIKDRLLGCYLTPYFQKVLLTGKPILYIDCFAGKGRFDDGKDGSPLIALRIREDCLKRTIRSNKTGAMKTCFIDRYYGKELGENIASISPSYDAPEIIHGKYEDNIMQCLQNKRGHNVFLYVDPYGIKALDMSTFDKIQTIGFNSFEMLINFNSFGFFRDACRAMRVDYHADVALQDLDELVEYEPTVVDATKQSEELLSKIAGGDYWKAIVTAFQNRTIDGYQAEQRLSNGYKKALRQRYAYVLDMPIRLKPGQRPKYRMIHVCEHEDGCFLMAQNMQKRKNELFINIQQKGQLSIYDMETFGALSAEGDAYSREDIAALVEKHILTMPSTVRITKFMASFVNENGIVCEFKMLHKILEELQAAGKIEILRNPEYTTQGKRSAFWEEKSGHQVIIRRKNA